MAGCARRVGGSIFHFPWFDRSPEREPTPSNALPKQEKCTREGQKKSAGPPEPTRPGLSEQEQSAPVSNPVHDDEPFPEPASNVEQLELCFEAETGSLYCGSRVRLPTLRTPDYSDALRRHLVERAITRQTPFSSRDQPEFPGAPHTSSRFGTAPDVAAVPPTRYGIDRPRVRRRHPPGGGEAAAQDLHGV
jgi:hypothetical protein